MNQSPVASRQSPGSRDEAAAALAGAARKGLHVRIVGGGTKVGWGAPVAEPDVELSTAGLDRIREHNAGDLTAVVEAGAPLARVQEELAGAGQMLALDPPLGEGGRATFGGVVGSADSGPLRHRYGSARDLVLGITVALSEGTLAKAGGKVIKNVAGYDLAKLFAGSFGTLGLIVEVAVRLHPLPRETATTKGVSADPALVARGAAALAHSPLEMQSLDVRWEGGRGEALARFGGAAPEPQAGHAARRLRETGLEADVVTDDVPLWDAQREAQRSSSGTIVRVSGVATQLEALLAVAKRLRASVVGRAALGLSWIRLEDRDPAEAADAVAELRTELAPSPCVVLDAPPEVRERAGVWNVAESPALELMGRVKRRFDPAEVCNPGVFVGGI
jgi:glycolate oxidase FAD binding subunit